MDLSLNKRPVTKSTQKREGHSNTCSHQIGSNQNLSKDFPLPKHNLQSLRSAQCRIYSRKGIKIHSIEAQKTKGSKTK